MPTENDGVLQKDRLFKVLSNPRRRYVLQYLSGSEDEVDLGDLTDAVAAWEMDTDPERLTQEQRKHIYISLYHTHLPLLDSAGLVDLNRENEVVTLPDQRPDASAALEDEIETVETRRSWELYYLAVAVGGFVTLGSIAVGLVTVDQFWMTVVTMLWIAVFAGLAIAQLVLKR